MPTIPGKNISQVNAQRCLDATGYNPAAGKTPGEHLSDWQFEMLKAVVRVRESTEAGDVHAAGAVDVVEE